MMYQRNDSEMAHNGSKDYGNQSHCYTNPSFCRQSEYLPEDPANSSSSGSSDLPPPPPLPQFQQMEDLPPPPDLQQGPPDYGEVNQAFQGSPEANFAISRPVQRSVSNLNRTTADRYCYIDESAEQPSPPPTAISHKRYGSLPMGGGPNRQPYRVNRYEYIQDDTSVQLQMQCQPIQPIPARQPVAQQQQQQLMTTTASAASRYEYIEHQQVQQRVCPPPPPPIQQQQQQQQQPPQMLQQPMTPGLQAAARASVRSYRSADAHYKSLGPEAEDPSQWNAEEEAWQNSSRRQINTPKGRYTSIPMQEEYPPSLPERNNGLDQSSHQQQQQQQQRSNANMATQKLHEILTTPRKPRKRSQSEALSPIKTPQQHHHHHHHQLAGIVPTHRGGSFTPGCSPSSSAAGQRAMNSPMRSSHQQQQPYQQTTPQSRSTLSPRSKGPMTSTPNKEPPSARRCLPLNEPPTVQQQQQQQPAMLRRHLEDSQAYGLRSTGRQHPPRYQPPDSAVEEAMYVEHKKQGFYQGPEAAYISRTAVVSPLSPSMSEANTTLVSSTDKYDRKNAPLLLVLVGILTCGLAIYLSWSQERRYYYDSAVGCGAFCALAGASRSLRRTWTGLCLAGLCVLTCSGLLLLATKSPRPGTPLHDVTAGALCGVSLLGAALAFLTLLSPRCTLGRHHRVHSWIPSFAV